MPVLYCIQYKTYQDVCVLRDSLPLVEAVLTSGQIEGPASKFRLPGRPWRVHRKNYYCGSEIRCFFWPLQIWDPTQSLVTLFQLKIFKFFANWLKSFPVQNKIIFIFLWIYGHPEGDLFLKKTVDVFLLLGSGIWNGKIRIRDKQLWFATLLKKPSINSCSISLCRKVWLIDLQFVR